MDRIILETPRLLLREMTKKDYPALCRMLMDPEVMYAYAHAFEDGEAHEWLNRQMDRYREYGIGLWAVILKKTGRMIGQCGLTWQPAPSGIAPEERVLEVGYLLEKAHWHNGYAAEAAAACRDYAFEALNAETVYSIIRDTNIASRHVAERNGMKRTAGFVKHYYNIDMPHDVYMVSRSDLKNRGL